MNYLAHIFLSGKNEEVLIGNFIADSIRNKQVEELPEGMKKGVLLHRKIDTFTDQHPAVKETTKLLNAAHGKYAPVLLDIFYDYFLMKNWERYSDEDFDIFKERSYRILEKHMEWIPLKMRKNLPAMIAADWLTSYGKLEGIEFTISKVKSRVSKPDFLENPIESIFDHEEMLNNNFNLFFPDLQQVVKEEMKILRIID